MTASASHVAGPVVERVAACDGRDGSSIDPEGCRAYAAGAAKRLDARIAEERRGGGQ